MQQKCEEAARDNARCCFAGNGKVRERAMDGRSETRNGPVTAERERGPDSGRGELRLALVCRGFGREETL
jgi:hypothetical protein